MKKRILCLLEDNDIDIVNEQAAIDGEGFNAALRKIIRESTRRKISQTEKAALFAETFGANWQDIIANYTK